METDMREPREEDAVHSCQSHWQGSDPSGYTDLLAREKAVQVAYFSKKLINALLVAEAEIDRGFRFQLVTCRGDQHWSIAPAVERPLPDRDEYFEQILIFPIDIPGARSAADQELFPLTPEGCNGASSVVTQYRFVSNDAKDTMAAATAQHNDRGVSPSSSPRLPSPPPFTEVQFGPKSPAVTGAPTEFSLDSKPDDGASRRIRPGTKAVDMARGPPFVALHQLDSPFQLQEYLQSLYAKLTFNTTTNMFQPIDREIAKEIATPPTTQETGESVDRNLWLYELCRLLCKKTDLLIGSFLTDNPPCRAETCPEMRASEWQYLCAVHEPPKSCAAIDYCCHTLDWASNVLSSPKHFPSRLQIGEGNNGYLSMRQLTNIFRRVYRIYAHGWFQHREVFWAFEGQYGLYLLFKYVCDQYQLIPEDNYTIPPEAEGEREGSEEQAADANQAIDPKAAYMSILRKNANASDEGDAAENNVVSTGATTRRHKHTPSTGVPVAVITEGQEDDEEEDTMIDLGAPGPAQETSTSLSPSKPRVDRAKSPGLIEIPETVDPDRVPEDPTPIAVYETSPFGSPGPSEVIEDQPRGAESQSQPVASGLGQHVISANDEDTIAPEPGSIAANPEVLSAVLSQLEETDKPKVAGSDTATQIIADENQKGATGSEEAEVMEKIDVTEVQGKDQAAKGKDEASVEGKLSTTVGAKENIE